MYDIDVASNESVIIATRYLFCEFRVQERERQERRIDAHKYECKVGDMVL